MQIVENWSELEGTVVAIAPSTVSGHLAIDLSIDRAGPVPGFPNLLADQVGKVLTVQARIEHADELGVRPSTRISCYARKADQHRNFCHPDRMTVLPKTTPPPSNPD